MGPLMSYEQVKDVDERLTDFLFTKYIMTSYAEVYGTTTEKGLYTKPSIQVFFGLRQHLRDQGCCFNHMTLCLPGYVESHEDLLAEALYTMCNAYNKTNHQRIDPVFFHEAIHHAARISRVMVSVSHTRPQAHQHRPCVQWFVCERCMQNVFCVLMHILCMYRSGL